MFKKFNRWLSGFFDNFDDHAVTYDDHPVIIQHHEYKVITGKKMDIKRLLEIEREIYGHSPWDRISFEVDMGRRSTLYLLLVDQNKHNIVGFIGASFNFYSKDVHISNIGVIPEYQRNGLGGFLLSEINHLANKYQFESVSLEVRKSNTNAQKLYQHVGFTYVQTRYHYYRDNGEDAYDMLKKLNPERI